MQAQVFEGYGPPDVITARELPAPTPGPEDLLVRFRASSMNPIDLKIRAGKIKILTGGKFPKLSLTDFAGEVERAPAGSAFKTGDRVFGMVQSMGRAGLGASAELFLASPALTAKIPEGLSFLEAACLPVGAVTAMLAMQQAAVSAGKRVLIHGATGGVGIFAVQLARQLGAEVTAVCSARNAGFARELGAAEVLPYDEAPYTAAGKSWDVVFDIAGTTTFGAARAVLASGGSFITTEITPLAFVTYPIGSALSGKRAQMVMGFKGAHLLPELARLVLEKKLRVHLEATLPLSKLREAHALAEKRPRGKIGIEGL